MLGPSGTTTKRGGVDPKAIRVPSLKPHFQRSVMSRHITTTSAMIRRRPRADRAHSENDEPTKLTTTVCAEQTTKTTMRSVGERINKPW